MSASKDPPPGEMTPKTDLTPPRLEFPCEYPIKVVARAGEKVRSHLDAIVDRHAGPLDLDLVVERPSAHSRFVSITYTITARSPEHIAELFEALKQHPQVIMVL